MTHLREAFISHLRKTYPGLGEHPWGIAWDQLVSENLLCPFEITVPRISWDKIQELIGALFTLRQTPAYQKLILPEFEARGLQVPGNKSIMMSYDFHLGEDGLPRLIEVNTNAAFLFLGLELMKVRGLPAPNPEFSAESVRRDILEELLLNGNRSKTPRVHIIDENPAGQRLFVEFLIARELMKSWGWECEIKDVPEALGPMPDFVYNRWTDFYFETPMAFPLRNAYVSRVATFSPQPAEYAFLADKRRLVDWSRQGFLESCALDADTISLIRGSLPRTEVMTRENADSIWARRKNLFIKPRQAFGSKKAYKGASISRKLFDELLNEDMVAQEYVPAPERVFETPSGPQPFKFDLRCYAYQGELQFAIARVFQGQVTNLKTPFGGFAPVRLLDGVVAD